MDLIFFVLFVAILLFLFSPTLRAWLLSRFLAWVQRRVLRQMQRQSEEAQRRGTGAGRQQGYYRGAQDGAEDEQVARARHQGKLGMDDIAAKKFDKPQSEDYVDFEELPK